MSRQAAWEAHDRWINGQAALHEHADHRGIDFGQVQDARTLAGQPDD